MKNPKIINCIICDKEVIVDHLGQHLKKYHNYNYKNNTKQYYDTFIKKNNEGMCLECNKETKFYSYLKGYYKYCTLKCCSLHNFDRMRIRNKEIHGDSNYSNRKKFKETTKERKSFIKAKETREKTNIMLYGDKNYNNREKYKQTCLDIFGYPCNLMLPKTKEKVRRGVSAVSQELFNYIYTSLNTILKKEVQFDSLNKEFITYHTKYKFYSWDFCIEKLKLIIEFNGDLWHANPTLFNENSQPLLCMNNKITAKEIWNKNKIKIDFIKNKGYTCLIVWESDYLKNKEKIVKQCLNFINQKNNQINSYKDNINRFNTIEMI